MAAGESADLQGELAENLQVQSDGIVLLTEALADALQTSLTDQGADLSKVASVLYSELGANIAGAAEGSQELSQDLAAALGQQVAEQQAMLAVGGLVSERCPWPIVEMPTEPGTYAVLKDVTDPQNVVIVAVVKYESLDDAGQEAVGLALNKASNKYSALCPNVVSISEEPVTIPGGPPAIPPVTPPPSPKPIGDGLVGPGGAAGGIPGVPVTPPPPPPKLPGQAAPQQPACGVWKVSTESFPGSGDSIAYGEYTDFNTANAEVNRLQQIVDPETGVPLGVYLESPAEVCEVESQLPVGCCPFPIDIDQPGALLRSGLGDTFKAKVLAWHGIPASLATAGIRDISQALERDGSAIAAISSTSPLIHEPSAVITVEVLPFQLFNPLAGP